MTNPTSPATVPPQPSSARPVLVWHPETDESHVEASVEGAAQFLEVSPRAVLTAIEAGELVAGWFVDWQAAQ